MMPVGTLSDSPVSQKPPAFVTDEERLAYLGVDLSKYHAIENRVEYNPIISRANREIYWPIIKSFTAQIFEQVPDPVMITHIVTTRCNYSCHFCSFADTLNAKTNELTLEEIEQVYATVGRNLNVIVYSGGETTLNRNLAEIIEAAYQRTPVKSVYIISNAWKPDLIFQITHQVMQRCPGLHLTWSLSIEGPKDINNATRHTKASNWDAWQNTVDAAEGLKRMRTLFGYKELDVQMCTVCSPSNVDILDDWYATIRDVLQPDKWNLNLMRRSVQMSDSQLADFDTRRQQKTLEPFEEKYLEVTQRVRQDVLSGKLKFLYHTGNPMDGAMKSAVDLISQEENRRTVLEEPLTFCCKAAINGAYISSDGDVSGCEEFAHSADNKSFGNLREVDYNFHTLWHGQKATTYRKLVGKAKECRGCTLESQRNYPAILVSFKSLVRATKLARQLY